MTGETPRRPESGGEYDAAKIAAMKFEGMDVMPGPTREAWLKDLQLVRMALAVLKYDDGELAARWREAEDPEVLAALTEALPGLRERLKAYAELANTAEARMMIAGCRLADEVPGV